MNAAQPPLSQLRSRGATGRSEADFAPTKGGIEMDKRKQYTVTNAGAQVVQPVHKQPAGAANQVVRGTDLRTGQTCKKG